jgi:large subunit ribosomal protein L23
MHVYEVLLRPIMTEKSMDMSAEINQYTFEVALKANKRQIQEAVEKIFNVTVTDVRTLITKGKNRRWGRNRFQTASRKKAIVTLAAGESITFFEGV